MDLRALLAGLTSAAVPQVPEVTGVCCDSQRIRPGDVFVAIPGFREDGRCHIAEAKARGAVCVLSREPVQELPWAAVQDPRRGGGGGGGGRPPPPPPGRGGGGGY